MNHKKSRVMDFFRRIDKDQDGKITRQEFIDGILSSSKQASKEITVTDTAFKGSKHNLKLWTHRSGIAFKSARKSPAFKKKKYLWLNLWL